MCFAPQQRPLFEHLDFQKCSEAEVFCTFSLPHVLLRATAVCTFWTSQLPKVFRSWNVLSMTSTCASRHNGLHFFDIATSKNAPTLRCFVHVYLEMCFAPQRRARFRHRNVQKWSGAEVFCTCSLGHVLRTTTCWCLSKNERVKKKKQNFRANQWLVKNYYTMIYNPKLGI